MEEALKKVKFEIIWIQETKLGVSSCRVWGAGCQIPHSHIFWSLCRRLYRGSFSLLEVCLYSCFWGGLGSYKGSCLFQWVSSIGKHLRSWYIGPNSKGFAYLYCNEFIVFLSYVLENPRCWDDRQEDHLVSLSGFSVQRHSRRMDEYSWSCPWPRQILVPMEILKSCGLFNWFWSLNDLYVRGKELEG